MTLSDARLQLASAVARTIEHLRANGVDLPADLLAWRGTPAPDQFIDVPDGIMVAFYPPPTLARQLAVPGGEPPDGLHMTLALPGKISQLSDEQLARLPAIVKGFGMISRPLQGTITGPAEFAAREGIKPAVLLVDVPGLPAWRQRLVEALALNGYTVATDHGYIPHITLAYVTADQAGPVLPDGFEPTPLTFDRITLVLGNRRRSFALGGLEPSEGLESFAATGARPRKEVAAVNAYQAALESTYDEWAEDCAQQLAEADEEDRSELLLLLLLLLLGRLRKLGEEYLPGAVNAALGDTPPPADVWARLAAAIAQNDDYLENSLLPALRLKLEAALADSDVLAAFRAGPAAAAAALRGALATFAARVTSYAGEFWKLVNFSRGAAAAAQKRPIRAFLDAQAPHCDDCPQFHSEDGREYDSWDDYLAATGGRVPGQFQCAGNCRCWVEIEGEDGRMTVSA